MNKRFSLLLLMITGSMLAQLPETDIWLFKLTYNKHGEYSLQEPLNVSNRKGYDNQPCFSEDGKKIYYSCVKEEKQADIYYYDTKSKSILQLSHSKESEYSPMPNQNGKFISCVMVETDSAQRIHFIDPVSGQSQLKLDFDSVGYYHFLNNDTVVYYKLTEPHSLRYFSKSSKADQWLCNQPIRGFKAINRHSLIYGIKDSVKTEFYIYDFLIRKAKKYCEYPSLNEDILWHPKWGLMKSELTQILRYDEPTRTWKTVFDLQSFGIKRISRFMFDKENKQLVLVNTL